MTEQTKRGPGRPPLRERAKVQDMHLNLPIELIEAIDATRGNKSRTDMIMSAIRSHPDIARYLRYGDGSRQ